MSNDYNIGSSLPSIWKPKKKAELFLVCFSCFFQHSAATVALEIGNYQKKSLEALVSSLSS